VSQLSRRTVTLSAVASSILATGALLLTMGIANGQELLAQEPPVSGDDRATAHPGNIKMDDCATAGLAGEAIDVESTDDGVYITITSVPDGFELTGVVVKGGDAYNVYAGDHRTDLHAPLNASGGPAGISHWFACGTEVDETTTTETTTTETTTTDETTSTDETTTDDTTTTAPGGGDDDEDLADTGVSAGGMLLVAGLLMLAGVGLVLATRRRAFSGIIKH